MVETWMVMFWRVAAGVALLLLWLVGMVLVIGIVEHVVAAIRRKWRAYQVRQLLRDVHRRSLLERRIGRRD
jgi:biopolymer transport protein ExbB/TolQ